MYNFVKNKQQELFVRKKNSKHTVTTKDSLELMYKWIRVSGIHKIHDNNNCAFYFYFIVLNGLVVTFLPVAFFLSYFLHTDELDYSTLFTSIQVFINIIGSSAKVIALIFMTAQLLTAEEVMAQLDERVVAEDEIEHLYKMKKLGRKLVIAFAMSYWSYSTSTFISSVLAGHPPYSLYLPYINWRNSRWEFLVTSFIEWILMSGACFQEVANDAYAAVYVGILRTHINILALKMKKLGMDPDKTLEENYEELKLCIKDHKNIIKLYDIVTPVISLTIFLQFTITALILGTTLINILIFATNFSSKVACCFYVLAVVVEVFPLCYYCNCLILDVEELANNIFHSSWINQNPAYRKMMRFFLQRAQQPMILTAGKIYPINLNSFISIAKFSFSLYTLIKKMDLKGKLGLD